MNTEEAWRTWWDAEGKHIERLPHHDAMDHMASVTRIAWLNGAFDAADEIERLRNKRDQLVRITNKLTVERDEARREVCRWLAEAEGGTPEEHAADQGWACFDEDENGTMNAP